MFRRAGRDLGLIHQVEAGWSLGGTLAPASSQPHPFLFGHFSIFCFGNGTDLCSLYSYHLKVWKVWRRKYGVERSFSSSPFGNFFTEGNAA